MKALNNVENLFGKISPSIQKRIINYINNPTFDNWDDIQCIIVNSDMTTIWQAILEIKPSFPRRGRSEDIDGNVIREWEEIPTPLEILQAIQYVTSE